ncbi:Rbr1 [Desulforapulum autotrophicum HRM2]|uniref:Rbr1 n=1 Tax=Desulforapulum autotrophicum (strain ATCC 43914 / DSM 3382 / VKM B-1955 / HRM2) TaxID=177437 RepID=C0QIU3_DESAH|nr:rubrerythrin family protein [Desulforapulum autotrophicum]ACN13733.1 Rbr1 [Desulforapulum autotrophicum HRM2]
MVAFRESKTAKNLLISFSLETQARTRYNFFADRARTDGYIQIARIFDETAGQECEHALRFFKFFNGGDLEITWTFPAGVIEDTRSNLLSAAVLEHLVHTSMYPEFAKTAEDEGFQRAADTLNAISVAERQHEKIYRGLAANLARDQAFKRPEQKKWRCLSCGYIHLGEEAPDKCPACVKPVGYFELVCENW